MGMDKQTIENQRQVIHDALVAGQNEARRTGKPMVILVGESHGDPTSTLNNLLVIEEARKLGVGNLALEFPETVTKVDGPARMWLSPEADGKLDTNKETLVTMGASLYPDMNVSAIDKARYQILGREKALAPEIKMAMRNDAMASELNQIPSDVVAVVGNLHMDGLNERMANKTVVAFNSAQPAPQEQYLAFIQQHPEMKGAVDFVEDAKVHQLGNITANGLQVSQIVSMAMGEERAAGALQRLNSAGFRVDVPTGVEIVKPTAAVGVGGDASRSHTVQKGETLFDLAAQQKDALGLVKQALGNNVTDKDATLALAVIMGRKSGLKDIDALVAGKTTIVMPSDAEIKAGISVMKTGVLSDGHIQYEKELKGRDLGSLVPDSLRASIVHDVRAR